jgi:GNAT superfamily N-acetyltransferase
MNVGTNLNIEVADNPSDQDVREVIDGVRAYNLGMTGNQAPRTVAAFLRDAHGTILGGAIGGLWGRSIHIAGMWVAERERDKGHGTALMKAVEDYAAARGHHLSYVETTSFQARPFYERLGYRVFAELEGIDEGCTMFFLRKDLPPPR